MLAALRLLQQENYPVSEMTSSWAGAFGQTQFMPSTFFKYATDGDGDGKIDLWSSPADALASTATLCRGRLADRQALAYEVTLPRDFDFSLTDLDDTGRSRTGRRWASRRRRARRFLRATIPRRFICRPGARGPAFMLFDNFRVIMKYNNAAGYALAVGMLADRMAGRSGPCQQMAARGDAPCRATSASSSRRTSKPGL